MNLDNFDEKATLIINSAFSYAGESNYAYLTPLNLLEVMLKTDDQVKVTLDQFSVNTENLYKESLNLSNKSKKKNSGEAPVVQGKVLKLL